MNKQHILLVGNCVFDEVFTLPDYPHQDEELRALEKSSVLGGNACNSAQILAQLGFDVELMSSVSMDMRGQWLLQQLKDRQISTGLCRQYAGSTCPHSVIWLNRQNGSRTIVHYRDLPELQESDLKRIVADDYQWIHFEGRNIPVLLRALPKISRSAVPLSLELEKARPQIEKLLPYVGTVIVSQDYLTQTKQTAANCIGNLKNINPDLQVVCTLGKMGLLASDSEGNMIEIQAERVEKVIDTIGAGDCFIAGLIARLAGQADFSSALSFANLLAANKIQNNGMFINV